MNYTGTLGTTTEVECMLAFMKLGYNCSIPYGNLARYDFIVDIDNKLYRIQCKTSRCIGDMDDPEGFEFNTTRVNTMTGKNLKYTYKKEEIDFFATCFSGKVYLFPIDDCLGIIKMVRLKRPKHNIGKQFYNCAEDYEISKFFQKSKEFVESEKQFKDRPHLGRQKHYCPECGKEVTKKGNYCLDCTNKKRRKIDWPDKETLSKLIKTHSFLEIGRMYEVSDSTVRRWCRSYGLPSKKSDINKESPNT